MSGILHDRDPRIEWRELTPDDVPFARDLLVAHTRGALPYGYHDTGSRTAWGGLVAGAINYGEVAIGATVNGGALCAVLVARYNSRAGGLVIEGATGADGFVTPEQLVQVARNLASQRGQQLVRRTVIPEQVTFEVA